MSKTGKKQQTILVMPGHLMSEARSQWKYVQKLIQAGWFGKKGEGFKPPSLLEHSLPGRERRKSRLRR